VYLSKVRVTLRPSILDPQGKAVEHAIGTLGISGVTDIRMGKYVEFRVDRPTETEARKATEEVCRKLLANPVMEDVQFDIEKVP
jgi:phosphoribosylformylglycinamidine synthase